MASGAADKRGGYNAPLAANPARKDKSQADPPPPRTLHNVKCQHTFYV
jgi:hypothetical protein